MNRPWRSQQPRKIHIYPLAISEESHGENVLSAASVFLFEERRCIGAPVLSLQVVRLGDFFLLDLCIFLFHHLSVFFAFA